MGIFKAKHNDVVVALSELKPIDYASQDTHMADIYNRLYSGRKEFANIYDLNVSAVAGTLRFSGTPSSEPFLPS